MAVIQTGRKNNLFSVACQEQLLFFCIFAASLKISDNGEPFF
jgi:hypothetical protein